ncbi:S24 family peptidase [Pseudoalteromonas sp. G4]|uniref:S24 family peptidase n=1 Tax=Pseudoalteromonas sp. G4 TaxID=2992761 RepID=UPI00237EB096|nr:S24 family peptidase [Pseudoalteromonas sp. G4]MDE3274170.1 nickel-type superoxide dismutase maturation protease [Pseudoalteromonas sp. G4]
MLGLSINKVSGDSMSPTIETNSYVLLHNFGTKKHLKKGQIVKVEHDEFGTIIKRIAYQDKNGLYWLVGDDPKSLACCQIGPVNATQITGILLCNLGY